MWTRWNMLSGLGWGTVFPIYTNLAVIAITYSLISPLILIFAALAFLVLYFAYLYNFLYVYNQSIDTGGMVFPRAIWQSFTGIYLLEICLTGLFGIATAYPELALFAITIPITAIYQILLQWKIENKLEYLDVTEADDLETGEYHHTDKETPTEEKHQPVLDSGRGTPDNAVNGHDTSNARKSGAGKGTGIQGTGAQGGTGVQGTGAGAATGGGGQAGSATNQAIDAGAQALAVQDSKGPARGQSGMNDYLHPAVTAPVPVVWIPEDPLGISKEEIRDTEAAGDIKITDGGASLDEKNKMSWNEDPPDYEP
jgi:calcium permeable stress-gated cation channel